MTDRCVQANRAGKEDRDLIFDPIRACLGGLSRIQILLSLFLSLESIEVTVVFFLFYWDLRRPIKTFGEDPGNCHAFSHPAILAMCFIISLDVEATLYPSHTVLKGWYVMLECTKLSPALLLCTILPFGKQRWNVKHYCHYSKNIHVHQLANYFLSGYIKICKKQFRLN